MTDHQTDKRETIVTKFAEAVNMSPQELETWLTTEESQEVGQKKVGDESKMTHLLLYSFTNYTFLPTTAMFKKPILT